MSAEETTSTKCSGSFQNWLKSALAVLFVKESITDFVFTEISEQQNDLLQHIKINEKLPSVAICNECTTANVLLCRTPGFCSRGLHCKVHDNALPERIPNQRCRNNICNHLRDGIQKEHRFAKPSWKNTDARGWCSEPVEIAKCYMPPDGYANVTFFENTDFNGILSVIINNKRFQTKIQTKLNKDDNLCAQARKVGHAIRHSPNFLLTDDKLSEYICILKELLSDPKYLASDPNAQSAVCKLNQLLVCPMNIYADDIRKVLDEQIGSDIRLHHQTALQEIKDRLSKESVAAIGEIDCAKLNALSEIQRDTDRKKKELNRYFQMRKRKLHIERIEQNMYRKKQRMSEASQPSTKYKELQTRLIRFYAENLSTISISPILEESDVPLQELYVQPLLEAVDIQHRFGNSQGDSFNIPVSNYQKLLFRNADIPYKHIYVTANAGNGKTSLSKHVCMTWCKAKGYLIADSEIYREEDVQALNYYEFVFFISLRDVNKRLCDLDKLVKSFVKIKLQNGDKYYGLVDEILGEKPTLIILDGLDEWVHPRGCERAQEERKIPHDKPWDKCTIITTTRDWKFEAIHLPTFKVDRHVKIRELDSKSSKMLVEKALHLLNKESVSKNSFKSFEEFETATSSLKLTDIIHIPYVNLQIVSLWHDGTEIGSSKCQIYSDVIEVNLKRGLEKHGSLALEVEQNTKKDLHQNLKEKSQLHNNLLFKLGKLAFHTLFREERESSLVFDESVANKYIESENELQFCFNVGLLSRSKVYGLAAKRRSHVFYQHKSIHEYFCALYIQSDFENNRTAEKIVGICKSLESILDMSNVFIFLSGLNSNVYTSLFSKIEHIATQSEDARNYRANLDWSVLLHEYYESMFSFQNFQVECAHESIVNGNANTSVHLEDIIIEKRSKNDYFMSALEKVKLQNLKSVNVREYESVEEFKETTVKLSLLSIRSLEKLDLWINGDVKDVEQLLSNNSNTLRSVGLRSMHYRDNRYHIDTSRLSTECLKAFTGIPSLQALILVGFAMTHDNLESLANFITRHKNLTQIGMRHIDCLDHGVTCEGVVLDLSQHEILRFISLHLMPLSRLDVHTKSLEACDIGHVPGDFASSLLKQMQHAPKLYLFSCMDYKSKDMPLLTAVLPKLLQLKVLDISYSDLGDSKFPLSSGLKVLERIKLWIVSMMSSSLSDLVEAIKTLPKPVVVTLVECTVIPETEYEKMKEYIGQSDKFYVIFDGPNANGVNEFTFQTVKTGECVR